MILLIPGCWFILGPMWCQLFWLAHVAVLCVIFFPSVQDALDYSHLQRKEETSCGEPRPDQHPEYVSQLERILAKKGGGSGGEAKVDRGRGTRKGQSVTKKIFP